MKRLIAVLILSIFLISAGVLTISAEEAQVATESDFVIFENGKYCVIIGSSDKKNKEQTEFINILVEHTGVPYDKEHLNTNENSGNVFIGAYGVTESAKNKIYRFNNDLYISFFTDEIKNTLFTDFKQKLKALPNDRIALDSSFWNGKHYIDDDSKASASEETNETKDEPQNNDNEAGFFETAGKVFKVIFNLFDIYEVDDETVGATLFSGGFNFIEYGGTFENTISTIYSTIYPIGIIVMIIAWSFSMAKSTVTVSFDAKDKGSIIYPIMSLIIVLCAMSFTPYILSTLTGISKWTCEIIGNSVTVPMTYPETTNILDMALNGVYGGITCLLITLFVDLIFILNILWIALLQCLSPIFIGLMVNKGSRKIGFNFIKEYFKALLIPIVTLCYWCLVSAFQSDLNASEGAGLITGLLGSIVLAISTLSIAGKKLDKLIN